VLRTSAAAITRGDRFGGGIVNGNTPWRASGTPSWQSGGGALGVRITGQRGARLPASMTPPAAGLQMRMPAAAADTILSDSRTHWQAGLPVT